MTAKIRSLPMSIGPAYIRQAEVIRVCADGTCRVALADSAHIGEILARSALPAATELRQGDRVLVAGESHTAGYIIGVLSGAPSPAIRSHSGAGAAIRGVGEDQSIMVHDDQGRQVFEFFPQSGRSVLNAVRGDLKLAAPNGNIDLVAGKRIRCRGREAASLTSGGRLQIAVDDDAKRPAPQLNMDQDGMDIASRRMRVTAGLGRVTFGRAVWVGQQLTSRIHRARLVYGKLDVTARRIWQRSDVIVRHITDLCQTQAGRLRTLVKGSHQVQSKRTSIIAKEDVRIDGDSINLG